MDHCLTLPDNTDTNTLETDMNHTDTPTEICFLHLRHHHTDGTIQGQGGATIAYRTTGAGIQFAAAFCSPADNFCRARGRTVAAGRLNSDRLRQQTAQTDPMEFRRSMLAGAYGI
jgi:hypothetical protein